MAVRPILSWPDTRLSTQCAPVAEPEDDLIADLFDTMYAAKGRGLAAPQIGVLKRVFVMDCGWKEGEATPLAMINPFIMAVERTEETGPEGCLSIPGVMVSVSRPRAVTVQWTAAEGDIHMADFDGFESRCIQHEFDHLNGIVTFDRLDDTARRTAEAHYREMNA